MGGIVGRNGLFVKVRSSGAGWLEGSSAEIETVLGLAIAKEIIKAHDGTITAESVMGLGTKFTVRLPAGANERAMPG